MNKIVFIMGISTLVGLSNVAMAQGDSGMSPAVINTSAVQLQLISDDQDDSANTNQQNDESYDDDMDQSVDDSDTNDD